GRVLDPREHDEVPVARRQRGAEEQARRLEARDELDADRLQLPLDDLEGQRAELVTRRRAEAEGQLADARAREDLVVARGRLVRTTGAALALEQADHLVLVERVPRVV